jgi:hypothetical protein
MNNILIIITSLFFSNALKAQVNYSDKISYTELRLFKKLEYSLKNTPFTLPKKLTDTFKLSKIDSTTYGNIFHDFFDTTQIKSNLVKGVDSSNNEAEQTNWLKMTTINAVFGIHKMLHCIPDSLFFVMQAGEYDSLTKEWDIPANDSFNHLLVAGYKSGRFYYPILCFLLSPGRKYFVYINFLINFESYPDEKKDHFNTYLEPLLSPCFGRLKGNYQYNQKL